MTKLGSEAGAAVGLGVSREVVEIESNIARAVMFRASYAELSHER